MVLLVIAYLAGGYWATGKTIFANKIVFYNKPGDLFVQRLTYGAVLGWALIPWALIKMWLS